MAEVVLNVLTIMTLYLSGKVQEFEHKQKHRLKVESCKDNNKVPLTHKRPAQQHPE